jgi:nitrate/nitrite transport system ATP-binding protein
MAFLELRNVGKSYGKGATRTEVLRDINLEVARGELVAIVGYSGAGKTTLVNLMAGLAAPDQGTIVMDGKPVKGPGADRGVVFQNYSLLPWLTAYENVHLAVDQTFAAWSPAKKQEHTEKYLALVNLAAARNKKPSELSGGMRQRVSLARALAMDPAVMLMDEPLGALDALTRATLQDEIARIWQSGEAGKSDDRAEAKAKTVVLITNDVDEAILLADRIIPLSMGPGASLGPPVVVNIPRPRDRKTMNHDEAFKAVRNQVIEYLLGPGRKRGAKGQEATATATAAATSTATEGTGVGASAAGVAA